MQYLSLWLISLSTCPPGSSILSQVARLPSFLRLNNILSFHYVIFIYMYICVCVVYMYIYIYIYIYIYTHTHIWPLNNTGLKRAGPLIHRLFSNSKYFSATRSTVGWIHRHGTTDTEDQLWIIREFPTTWRVSAPNSQAVQGSTVCVCVCVCMCVCICHIFLIHLSEI